MYYYINRYEPRHYKAKAGQNMPFRNIKTIFRILIFGFFRYVYNIKIFKKIDELMIFF